MKKTIIVVVMAAVLLVGSTTVALASDGWKTPAEIIAALTGKTVDQVRDDRQEGMSYGEQAAAAGKLNEFRAERLAQYKLRLAEAVDGGRLTQAAADRSYGAMKARMESCAGSGADCGNGMGNGTGNGSCRMGRGSGNGMAGRGRGAGCLSD